MTLVAEGDRVAVSVAEGLVPWAAVPTSGATFAEGDHPCAPTVRAGALELRTRDGAVVEAETPRDDGEVRHAAEAPVRWEAAR